MSDETSSRPGPEPTPPIQACDIRGAKFLRSIMDLLRPLHDHKDGPNRTLHYDEYVAYVLLYYFTPALTSMRGIQQVSTLEEVRRKFRLPRFSLGSFSEARNVFDPDLLEPILAQLLGQAAETNTDPRLVALGLTPTVVDSTMLRALPKMLWAFWRTGDVHAAKLHLEYSLLKAAPSRATLTPARRPDGRVLSEQLTEGKLYVLDRGYADYTLMASILETQSSFVVRLQHNAAAKVIEEHPLSEAARERGIVSDRTVRLGSKKTRALKDRDIRLVEVHTPTRDGEGPTVLLLATDRLDIDADLVADLYRYRWQVELFFRWFKTILGAERLLALSENGVRLVAYCALIASLLITVWTQRKPTKRTYEMLSLYFLGWVHDHELVAHIEGLSAARE